MFTYLDFFLQSSYLPNLYLFQKTLLVGYSVTAPPAHTVGSMTFPTKLTPRGQPCCFVKILRECIIIGTQAINLYGGPEASAKRELDIILRSIWLVKTLVWLCVAEYFYVHQ